MKKFLLSLAAVAMAASASADVIVDKIQTFEGMDKFPFFVMGYEPEIIDGILTVPEYPGGWYQFFVMDGLTFDPACEYTVTAKIKGSKNGSLNVQLGNWGALLEQTLDFTSEWSESSVSFYGLEVENGFSVFQPGTYDGKLEIEWVQLSHEGEAFVIPTEGDVVASYYTGNGETFGGWGNATFENVEEDGKPCLKFTNEAATDSWAVQMAVNYAFEPGETYFIGFDIKGDAASNLPSGFQAERNYASCGELTPFAITPEWNHVIIFGKAKAASVAEGEEPNLPARWLASLGQYVGTFYLTNFTIYTATSTGVAEDVAVDKGRTVVYNMLGVKVLDTDDASQLSTLKKGLYIVNGKKVIL